MDAIPEIMLDNTTSAVFIKTKMFYAFSVRSSRSGYESDSMRGRDTRKGGERGMGKSGGGERGEAGEEGGPEERGGGGLRGEGRGEGGEIEGGKGREGGGVREHCSAEPRGAGGGKEGRREGGMVGGMVRDLTGESAPAPATSGTANPLNERAPRGAARWTRR